MQLDNSLIVKQVEELATVLKPWSDQLVLGGGVALILYDLVLSNVNSGAVATTDIDFLIPRKPVKAGDEKISEILIENGYQAKYKSMDTPSVQSFVKQVDDVEIEVEFLTDNNARVKTNVVEIKSAGVNAQPLSYIEMSLKEATPLKLSNEETIYVVSPQAWVFHKGLTFPKRTVESKKYKDLYGIWFVLTQLKDTSVAAQKALPKLIQKNHESWAKTFKNNLKSWIDNASPKDWDMLARQDVNGVLNKAHFERTIHLIVI